MSGARRFSYPAAREGETVEERLLAEGYSKRLIVLLKQLPEGLTVAGKRVRSTRPLHPGEILAVALPLDPPRVHRLSVGVPVLYEDEDLTVYNKPAGMVCHRSGSHRYDTLENAAEGVFRAMNRLDKDTSGALVAAKHQLAAAKLWRNIEKSYLAVAHGRITGSGRMDFPLGREVPYEPKQAVLLGGLSAVTEYTALGYSPDGDCSLLRCRLLTGRMHQIRAHCAAAGHPLLGDALYGGDSRLIGRQALHCERVSFSHPISGRRLALSAPPPDDLRALLDACRLSAVLMK